jgi:hypothetical protein
MQRLGRGLLLVLVLGVWGLAAGCGGGIKEGGPPPGAAYVPPADMPKNEPEKAK